MKERIELSILRIKEISKENIIKEPFGDYFRRVAEFIVYVMDNCDACNKKLDIEELRRINKGFFEDILPESYDNSYGNPEYAVSRLGECYGQYLSLMYSEIRGIIAFSHEMNANEARYEDVAMLLELFLEVYSCFVSACEGADKNSIPEENEIKDILYYYVSDYADVTLTDRVREQVDSGLDFAVKIIEESDLGDISYLYKFGEYITSTQEKVALFLNSLSDKEIQAMADTYTEGYRIGFINTGKDLSIKKTVDIRYTLGFERVVKASIANFRKMGLEPVVYRSAQHIISRAWPNHVGFCGSIANRQYEYDHKEDAALFLDKAYRDRKLLTLKQSYEKYKDMAKVYAGPAVMEIFGEEPFSPKECKASLKYSDKQQALKVEMMSKTGEIINEYIKGEERSFTIIAYPVPDIGDDFQEIFRETVRLNTLDYETYQGIQQRIIDILDKASCVRIKGYNGNTTDLTVKLHDVKDPLKETKFENCVADVNIPVGEVFTSPVLEGTNGELFVSEVYLNDLKYINLRMLFKDGMVESYSCDNFEDAERGKKYIKDNVLFNHETLPMGEFAIGTNTTAYAMAKKYNIFDRLPILIAEKTGPHFAIGDTCYSHAEDVKVYNPDGKEIIARDNSLSINRKTEPQKAYFNCHTDITMPYDELYLVEAVCDDGEVYSIIKEGKFVLPGCELLNEALN